MGYISAAMPIYEYRCAKCGSETEVFQKVSDPAPASCAACGVEGEMSRLVSKTSFQLKGGGWFSDLYSSVPKSDGGSGDAPKAAPKKQTSDA